MSLPTITNSKSVIYLSNKVLTLKLVYISEVKTVPPLNSTRGLRQVFNISRFTNAFKNDE
jgi:hypothetical protein